MALSGQGLSSQSESSSWHCRPLKPSVQSHLKEGTTWISLNRRLDLGQKWLKNLKIFGHFSIFYSLGKLEKSSKSNLQNNSDLNCASLTFQLFQKSLQKLLFASHREILPCAGKCPRFKLQVQVATVKCWRTRYYKVIVFHTCILEEGQHRWHHCSKEQRRTHQC